jgi:sugar/nucleoside kinase (ribokinase family)
MPRLLAVGHVTWDRGASGDVLGGSVSYAALTAAKLGWEAAVLTSAARDFVPERDLPGVMVFQRVAGATTRFHNHYSEGGGRRQSIQARSDDIDLSLLPDTWRDPDALLLAPVVGEVAGGSAMAFEAGVVGASAQGWLRHVDTDGSISPRAWPSAGADLVGVHALFLSEQDLPREVAAGHFLTAVPMVALTRGWEGLSLLTRDGVQEVPSLPRAETDPTGAGDAFAAAFLVRYHETQDALEAAAFAACAASCAVEAVGAAGLGDRDEVNRRLALRERLIEEGEWDE